MHVSTRALAALGVGVILLAGCGSASEGFQDGLDTTGEKAPQSCLDAIEAAEEAMGLVVEANEVILNWIGGIPQQSEIDQVERITEEVRPVVQEFNTTKTECRAAG